MKSNKNDLIIVGVSFICLMMLLCSGCLVSVFLNNYARVTSVDNERGITAKNEAVKEHEQVSEVDDSKNKKSVSSLAGIPEEIVELLNKGSELETYVYSYHEKKDMDYEINLIEEASMDSVPLLIQWDERWGYEKYGSGLIGYTGCGPTCLSMVAIYLSHNATYTPLYIANYADEHGYFVEGAGTSWELMYKGCRDFGITAKELSLNEATIKEWLDVRKPIICSVGAGDFTDEGHFIVIAGYSEKGLIINDPNSIERSLKVWEFERIKGQIKNLWGFSLSEEHSD